MKLTQWFPGDVKPVRVGVYERLYFREQLETRYSYWNGEEWSVWSILPSGAALAALAAEEKRISMCQDLPWRGVMK